MRIAAPRSGAVVAIGRGIQGAPNTKPGPATVDIVPTSKELPDVSRNEFDGSLHQMLLAQQTRLAE